MVVKKSESSVRKISDKEISINDVAPLNQRISLDVVNVTHHHEKTIAAYNRIYFVSDGCMNLLFKNQSFALQKGDACFVQKGTTFELEGSFSVIIVSHSSFPL